MTAPAHWVKQGLIFTASGRGWLHSHAALPVADAIGKLYRIYFSSRDEQGRAQIGSFDFDLKSRTVLAVSENPVIALGALGAFDDRGVTSSCLVNYEGRKYQYYTGWTVGVTVPFYFYVGLAVSEDDGVTYTRVSLAPILERNSIDPYLTASPCVLIENGVWRMWYVSGTGWEMKNGQAHHYYHIKYAESSDGINWRREGVVCIDYQSEDEYAIARPCVVKDDDVYQMWYSYRGQSYRVGYAESKDGLRWERKDAEVGIDVAQAGWDSEMIEYPFVFDHEGERYMLYNGNGYGRTGVGLATLDLHR